MGFQLIFFPKERENRRAAIRQAIKEAGWIRALSAVEQAADQAFFQGDIEAGCNLIDVCNWVKESKLKGDAGNGPAKPSA